MWSFKRRGQPITAAKYIKQAWGPVAKPLLPVLDELHRHSVVVQRRERFPSGSHVKFFSVGEPDLSPFTADEIAMVDEIIDIVCYEHTAKSISDLSHDLTWNMHAIGEEMPLYRSHVMQLGQVTDEDIAWAKGQVPQTA